MSFIIILGRRRFPALLTPDVVDEAVGKSVPLRLPGASGSGDAAPLWPGGCHSRVPQIAFSWTQWLGPLVFRI